jgi:MFS family permease
MAKGSSGELSGFRLITRALSHRNYRLFFGGQSISLIGTWMQQIALSWLVYRITGSALLLGVVGFASNIPVFVIAPFAGLLADRWNRHKMVIVIQCAATVQALILAVLVLTNLITVWQIIALGVLLGIINAFDIPTRQSFVVDMVERREDLGNAIALNSSMFNVARLLGPSVAGILIAAVGEGYCFLINAISYIPVIIALLMMRIKSQQTVGRSAHVVRELKEGFKYAFGFTPIRSLLFLLALVSLIGMPYSILMPIFAKNVLHGDAHTLGFLVGASGIGALIGAIYLASRKSVRGLGRVIPISAGMFGAGLLTFSFSRFLPLSLMLMVITGFGMITQMASSNTVLQTIVDEDKRGRVMAFYTMSIRGMSPFGSLLAGSLAASIGAPNTLLIGGLCCMLGALWFARNLGEWRKYVRPIYVQKGIIPEVANGLRSAAEMTTPPKD